MSRRSRLERVRTVRVVVALALLGCSPTAAPLDGGRLDAPFDAPRPPPWPHDLPAGSELGDVRGLTHARVSMHMHSPLSHDACDGEGFVDGALADAACLQHLREAACTLRLDALMLTDHTPHIDEVSFEAALWATGPSDELIRDVSTGLPIAARWACPDGRLVIVTVGSENTLMPIGLTRHPVDPSDRVALADAYDADGRAAADVFRAAGAVVFYAHTEEHSLEQIRTTVPDGIEIYNTHANVDPNIRADSLGLEPLSYLGLLTRFTVGSNGMESDLSFLSFFSENQNALDKWDTLLAEGMHLTGMGGSDAHENTFASLMPDGERGDSYRRMMRWHTHHVLVPSVSRDAIVDAVRSGRLYVAFEAFGTPIGFDFHAERLDGSFAEMGGDAAIGDTLALRRPSLPAGFPSEPAPLVSLRILRAAPGGAVEIASGSGATLEHVVTEPGVYRAEVHVTPEHARPYLGRFAGELVRDVAWVYSNPIYVE